MILPQDGAIEVHAYIPCHAEIVLMRTNNTQISLNPFQTNGIYHEVMYN